MPRPVSILIEPLPAIDMKQNLMGPCVDCLRRSFPLSFAMSLPFKEKNMRQPNRTMLLTMLVVFAVIGLSQIALETYVDARAGGGRSGGFRGSRTYQSPSRSSQPSQPRREAAPPSQQPSPVAPQAGGFMRG